MYGDYSYISPESISSYSTIPIDEIEIIGSAVFGILAGIAAVMVIVGLIVGVLTIIANWKIFTKAGEKGWKSLIPIYNTVTLFKIAGLSPLWIFGYFASAIPFIGWIAVLGLTIYLMYNLAKAFGKDSAFTVGLVLLNTIFMMILGFGKSEYQLNKTEVTEITE